MITDDMKGEYMRYVYNYLHEKDSFSTNLESIRTSIYKGSYKSFTDQNFNTLHSNLSKKVPMLKTIHSYFRSKSIDNILRDDEIKKTIYRSSFLVPSNNY